MFVLWFYVHHVMVIGNVTCRVEVLRFYGWLKQTVHESQVEHFRVRHVRLYYYLEDDSIEIVEAHVRDSGMPQGCHSFS